MLYQPYLQKSRNREEIEYFFRMFRLFCLNPGKARVLAMFFMQVFCNF